MHTGSDPTSQGTQWVSITKTIRLSLFKEITAVYCENHITAVYRENHITAVYCENYITAVYRENHTEHINTLCGQSAEIFNYHDALISLLQTHNGALLPKRLVKFPAGNKIDPVRVWTSLDLGAEKTISTNPPPRPLHIRPEGSLLLTAFYTARVCSEHCNRDGTLQARMLSWARSQVIIAVNMTPCSQTGAKSYFYHQGKFINSACRIVWYGYRQHDLPN
jgi:hypothetical protein